MTVWFKMGVEGDLSIPAQKCLGRIHDLYQRDGLDLYVTSKRDGNHMAGSLHYNGNAFDFRKMNKGTWTIRHIAGKGFDVVPHSSHFHVEYDPKEGE